MWRVLHFYLILNFVRTENSNSSEMWEYEELTLPTCSVTGPLETSNSPIGALSCVRRQCTEDAAIVIIPVHLLDSYTGTGTSRILFTKENCSVEELIHDDPLRSVVVRLTVPYKNCDTTTEIVDSNIGLRLFHNEVYFAYIGNKWKLYYLNTDCQIMPSHEMVSKTVRPHYTRNEIEIMPKPYSHSSRLTRKLERDLHEISRSMADNANQATFLSRLERNFDAGEGAKQLKPMSGEETFASADFDFLTSVKDTISTTTDTLSTEYGSTEDTLPSPYLLVGSLLVLMLYFCHAIICLILFFRPPTPKQSAFHARRGYHKESSPSTTPTMAWRKATHHPPEKRMKISSNESQRMLVSEGENTSVIEMT